MLERKPVIDEKVNVVMEHLKALKRGDVLHLVTLERLTGVARYTGIWTSLVKKLKRRMVKERGIDLWPVIDVGYELSTVKNQLERNTVKRQRRATRQLTRGIDAAASLPAEELSTHQQAARALKVHHMTTARRLVKRQVRDQAREAAGTPTTPQVAAFRKKKEK